MGMTSPAESLTMTRSVGTISPVSMKTTEVWSSGSVRTPRRSMKDLFGKAKGVSSGGAGEERVEGVPAEDDGEV